MLWGKWLLRYRSVQGLAGCVCVCECKAWRCRTLQQWPGCRLVLIMLPPLLRVGASVCTRRTSALLERVEAGDFNGNVPPVPPVLFTAAVAAAD